MTDSTKKRIKFTLRWGIAIAGIWWVVSGMNFRDRVTLLDPTSNKTVRARVLAGEAGPAGEDDRQFTVIVNGAIQTVQREDLWIVAPRGERVTVAGDAGAVRKEKMLAIKPGEAIPGGRGARTIRAYLVEDSPASQRFVVDADKVLDATKKQVASPLVEIGLNRLVRQANPWFLLAAIVIVPISFLLTSLRWFVLLRGLDIRISQPRAFVLNMVGAFYNAFMPGTTGGDIIKAYYAAKHTDHRTWAVFTVVIDRIIGLIALIIVGGVMAAYQWDIGDCRHVAILCGIILSCVTVGLITFYYRPLRRGIGLDFLLSRLPMQKQVHKLVEAMDAYGKHPRPAFTALLLSFPVHIITTLSATFAGEAFGLPLRPFYYWVVVPIVALAGALPLSPQGIGVMEPLTWTLTQKQGATISQAFVLTMCIRLVQMFWNLVAGVFVLRGGYHAPTVAEQEELEESEKLNVDGAVDRDPPAMERSREGLHGDRGPQSLRGSVPTPPPG